MVEIEKHAEALIRLLQVRRLNAVKNELLTHANAILDIAKNGEPEPQPEPEPEPEEASEGYSSWMA